MLACFDAERFFIGNAKLVEFDKSGSSAIIALVVDEECYIANIGDS